MFGQNKVKLLLVVLFVTTLFDIEVNGAAVNKTVAEISENEKDGMEGKSVEKRNSKDDTEYMRFQRFQQQLDDEGKGPIRGNAAKVVAKRNLNEDAENLRVQRFQQVLDEGAGGAAAHKGFFSVIMSAAVLSGLITYMRM